MQNQYIQLVPADLSLAEQVVDYYRRNRKFLEEFEPKRKERFFTLEYQQKVLEEEMYNYEECTAFRFYIKLIDQPHKIIGMIGLNNVIWGAFRSAFLGYKLTRCATLMLTIEIAKKRRKSLSNFARLFLEDQLFYFPNITCFLKYAVECHA